MNPLLAFCHRCGKVTPTRYLLLSSGHIANACADCRACRKGRPYISKSEYEKSLTPPPAAGGHRVIQAHDASN